MRDIFDTDVLDVAVLYCKRNTLGGHQNGEKGGCTNFYVRNSDSHPFLKRTNEILFLMCFELDSIELVSIELVYTPSSGLLAMKIRTCTSVDSWLR